VAARDAHPAVQLRLDRREILALGLQRPGVREVQMDQQQRDVRVHVITAGHQ